MNVSAVQLRRQDFIDIVSRTLSEAGIGSGIDIELTESLLMENITATIQKLQALSAMGVNVSIDDFGTGYSSLAYLAKLPVQGLKIDRAFLSTMLDSPDNMTLVSTMIALAHSLRLAPAFFRDPEVAARRAQAQSGGGTARDRPFDGPGRPGLAEDEDEDEDGRIHAYGASHLLAVPYVYRYPYWYPELGGVTWNSASRQVPCRPIT